MTVGECPHLRDKKGQRLEEQHHQGGPASRNAGETVSGETVHTDKCSERAGGGG